MKLQEALPGFYGELTEALGKQGLPALVEQLPGLEIKHRCPCDELGCGTFAVEAKRELNVVEQNVIGSRYEESFEIDDINGMVVLDVDNFGRLISIEILDRPDINKELERLNVLKKASSK